MDNKDLSEREIEILKLVSQGLSNKEIAQALFISVNTVKVHLRNVFAKISVVSRTEAALYAIEQGFTSSPGPEAVSIPLQEPSPFSKWLQRFWWVSIPVALGLIVTLSILISNGILFASPTPAPGVIQGVASFERWQVLAPLPEARSGLAVAAYDNAIYAIAGETESDICGIVDHYDPQTDAWTRLRDKPTPVTDVSAALLGEKIYVPGGELADGTISAVLEIYDPRKDTWGLGAPMPKAISAYALAAYEGKLYLFGGWDGQDYLDSVYIYDPAGDTWREGTPMPVARAYAGAAEAGGKIYVIGGRNDKESLSINDAYTPNRDRSDEVPWTQLPPLPEGQHAFGTQGIGELIFVVGKSTDERDTLLQFLPQNNLWTFFYEEPPAPIGQHIAVATLQGYLYILGGVDDAGLLSDGNLRYQAVYTIYIPVLQND
ncbi:MAG: LuxR C-terminal-related transcriptional regulator [Chloroflexota bacterium]